MSQRIEDYALIGPVHRGRAVVLLVLACATAAGAQPGGEK